MDLGGGSPNWERLQKSLGPSVHEFPYSEGESFLLTVGACLLTVKLLCLESLKALTRRTFSLQAKKAATESKKLKL